MHQERRVRAPEYRDGNDIAFTDNIILDVFHECICIVITVIIECVAEGRADNPGDNKVTFRCRKVNKSLMQKAHESSF